MPNISILNQEIRTLDGLFSLNDLHKASGANESHRPSNFIRTDQTKGLIAEIEKENSQSSNVSFQETAIKSVKGGKYAGTYGCHEIIYAYAMWISSAFYLKVIRYFHEGQKSEAPYSVNPTDSLTKEQADELRGLITSTAEKLPKSERASFTIKAWSKLKAHFGVKYRDIPQQHYVDALSIVSRHVAEVIAQPIPKQSMFHGLQDGCYHVLISEGKTTIADINAIEGELLPREETPKLPAHIADMHFDLQEDADYKVVVRDGKARRLRMMYCIDPHDKKQNWWFEA